MSAESIKVYEWSHYESHLRGFPELVDTPIGDLFAAAMEYKPQLAQTIEGSDLALCLPNDRDELTQNEEKALTIIMRYVGANDGFRGEKLDQLRSTYRSTLLARQASLQPGMRAYAKGIMLGLEAIGARG